MSAKTIATVLFSIVMAACGKVEKENTEPAVRVKTMVVGTSVANDEKMYSGTIEAGMTCELSFSGGGTLTRVTVKAGDRVSKGQLIATVDRQMAQNEYNSALSQEQKARDLYGRYRKMYEDKSLPEAQYIEAKSALRQSEMQLAMAKKQLTDCQLYAPFAGTIITRNVEPGQNVSAGTVVATLVDVRKMKACISVTAAEINMFRRGQNVRISVPDLDGQQFIGTITEKDIQADELSRTYRIKALIDNADGKLLPGMIANVKISGALNPQTTDNIIIPEKLVQIMSDNTRFVWLARDGKAKLQVVTIGNATSRGVIVESGLQQGDTLITEGQQKVSEGSRVQF